MRTQIGKWGNSLAVRIPRTYAKDLHLEEGMHLDVSIVEGEIILRPPSKQYSLEDLVAGITPENRHGETNWGQAAPGDLAGGTDVLCNRRT
jgi:antitoxin MazE